MNKRIIIVASIFGVLAVALGAFGAHALKNLISEHALGTWNTAVQYHFIHTLALLSLSNFSRFRSRTINAASWFFTFGILFFSGSLYILSLREVLNAGSLSFLGPVTPIGGVFFILGWLLLMISAIKNK